MNAIETVMGMIQDLMKAVKMMEMFRKTIKFIGRIMDPMGLIPKVGPVISNAKKSAVDPLSKGLDRIVPPLLRVRDKMDRIMQPIKSGIEAITTTHAQLMEITQLCPIFIQQVKAQTTADPQQCRRNAPALEAHSSRLAKLARETISKLKRVNKFQPEKVARKAVTKAVKQLKKTLKPVKTVKKMLDKLKKLLDKRVPVLIPGFKKKKVMGKKVKVPIVKKKKVSSKNVVLLSFSHFSLPLKMAISQALNIMKKLKAIEKVVLRPVEKVLKPIEKAINKPFKKIQKQLRKLLKPLTDFVKPADKMARQEGQLTAVLARLGLAKLRDSLKRTKPEQ